MARDEFGRQLYASKHEGVSYTREEWDDEHMDDDPGPESSDRELELEDEVDRLRALLELHGIDPDEEQG